MWLLPHGAKYQNVRVLRALDFVLSLWTGSKRCRNEKLREVYELLAPTYKEGLLRIKDADPAIAAAARRQERIAAAQRDLQAVALADQRADVESGEAYWMRDKYQELQRLAAEEGSGA